LAAADGVVIRVENVDNSFAGKFVAIDHGGVVSRYLHNLENLVTVGQMVTRGQKIALVGQTGTTGTGQPHLHFDVKLDAETFDEYRRRFGTPSPGYLDPGSLGVGVPAESLVAGAIYAPHVRESSLGRGVKFYAAVGALGIIALGVGVGFLVKTLR